MSQQVQKAAPRSAGPNFEDIAAPHAIVRQLEGRSMPELVALFRRAENAAVRGWMLMSLVVGVALERAKYGSNAAGRLAEELGCSERTISRLAELFSRLIRPRLTVAGERARFPLQEQQFYIIAVEGADTAGKDPLALLEEAERERAKDPKFSARAFKRRVYGESGRRPTGEPRLLTLLRGIANAKPDAIGKLASSGDPAALGALLDAASERLSDARRSLRRPQAA